MNDFMLEDELTVEHDRNSYDDRLEAQRFCEFLPTKNGCFVFELVGCDNTSVEE